MEPSVKRLIGLLLITTFCAASEGVVTDKEGVVTAKEGDVEIYIDKNVWRCDKIKCPPQTDNCRVIKKKETSDATQLIRSNVCYSQNNDVVKEKTFNESIAADQNINVVVNASRRGISSSSSCYSSGDANSFSGNKNGLGGYFDFGSIWGRR